MGVQCKMWRGPETRFGTLLILLRFMQGVLCTEDLLPFSLHMYPTYMLPLHFHNIRARSAEIDDKYNELIVPRNLVKSARSEERGTYRRGADCCVFLFLDGSAHYFDSFLREKTGTYTLQPGTINDYPHYANKECSLRGRYTADCTYIWKTNGAWIIGDGTSVGE